MTDRSIYSISSVLTHDKSRALGECYPVIYLVTGLIPRPFSILVPFHLHPSLGPTAGHHPVVGAPVNPSTHGRCLIPLSPLLLECHHGHVHR